MRLAGLTAILVVAALASLRAKGGSDRAGVDNIGSGFRAARSHPADVVDTVNLKDIFCDIEADPDPGHGDLRLNDNAVPPILCEPGSAVAEGDHPIWIRTISTRKRSYRRSTVALLWHPQANVVLGVPN